MSILKTIGYSYNDLTLVPSEISNVSSRSQCNPYNNEEELPIFTAPMASVVNVDNYKLFKQNKITPIIPRNIDLNSRIELMYQGEWVALSLKEFEDYFINNTNENFNKLSKCNVPIKICVDIANGHMKSLYEKCKHAKLMAQAFDYKLIIMTGNIANAETYKWIIKNCFIDNNYECCIDYIRVGIGGGSGCITTSNVSVHYPQASLIDACNKVKSYFKDHNNYNLPKIIADGGVRNYDHVIKALALGADYVMIGSVFAQCVESAGTKVNREINHKLAMRYPLERYRDLEIDGKDNWWGYYTDEFITKSSEPWRTGGDIDKYNQRIESLKEKKFIGHIEVKFFGMASADGQKSISGEKTKTAEGITKYLPVKYKLKGWVDNMVSYLRSAMSYTNCITLQNFIGNVDLIPNSISEIQAVNK